MRFLLPLVLLLLTTFRPAWADGPDAAIAAFLRALATGDAVGLRASVLPGQEGVERLVQASPREAAAVEEELARVEPQQEGPYVYRGQAVEDNEFPVGTRGHWMVAFSGSYFAVPAVLTDQGWKVDARFFLAPRETPEGTPELAVRKFVWFLLRRDATELAKVATEVPPLRGDAPFEDQYYALAEEMAVAPALPGEVLRFPEGELVTVPEPTPDHLFMLGQYGVDELPFELRRVDGSWKIVARDYLADVP